MNILIISNTYLPFVGGVEKSIQMYAQGYRERGHDTIIVAPNFPDQPEHEDHVVRVPAVQNFNGSDFSIQIPIPGILTSKLKHFQPDIIHSQHPFLLGDTALRLRYRYQVPLVYTFHTFYEEYLHYIPVQAPKMKKFVSALAVEYANLADAVISPAESTAEVLRHRGVFSPISVIPTGIDTQKFAQGEARAFRKKIGVDSATPLVGFVSRLAPEKNVGFLCEAFKVFLRQNSQAHIAIAGDGPSRKKMEHDLLAVDQSRVHFVGILTGSDLCDAYTAFDVFAFASYTETQGMVLAEALASGCPVVGLKATGTLDIIKDENTGILVYDQSIDNFAHALNRMVKKTREQRLRIREYCKVRSLDFNRDISIDKALHLFEMVRKNDSKRESNEHNPWQTIVDMFKAQKSIFTAMSSAVKKAIEKEDHVEKKQHVLSS